MRLAVTFTLLAAAWLALAVSRGGWHWLYLWPAWSFLIVAAAYAGLGARVLGKRADGTIAPWALVLLLPYFLLAWVAWRLHGLIARPQRAHEIVPGLWVGRRTHAAGLPRGVECVVDMTSEFWEPSAVRDGRMYVCLPTLDHHVPDENRFRELVRRVAESDQTVYVHCAHGYGRAAMVAAAVLILRGHAADLDEAERLIRRARPKIHLGRRQRRLVARLTR